MNIDEKALSMALGKIWWDTIYISGKDSREYEEIDFEFSHGIHISTKVKHEDALVFWNKVQDYAELIEKYKI